MICAATKALKKIIPVFAHVATCLRVLTTQSGLTSWWKVCCQDSDSIHAFISKKCRLAKDAQVSKNEFYQAYCEFCINSGREAHKKHAFMRTMRAQGFAEGRRKETREPVWIGIKFRKVGK